MEGLKRDPRLSKIHFLRFEFVSYYAVASSHLMYILQNHQKYICTEKLHSRDEDMGSILLEIEMF